MVSRLVDGVGELKVGEFFFPVQKRPGKNLEKWHGWRQVLDWRGYYLFALGGILAALLVVLATGAPKAQHAGHIVFKHGTTVVVLFVVGSFVGYSVLYGWYSPIAKGSGDRFMLSLFLPLVFSLIWGAEGIVRRIRRRRGNPWIARGYLASPSGCSSARSPGALSEIFQVLRFKIFTVASARMSLTFCPYCTNHCSVWLLQAVGLR